MSSNAEVELKLAIEPAAIAALRAHPAIEAAAIGAWRRASVDSRYFDTPDHALAKARIALRLRRVGRAWMQTLKASPASDDAMGALSRRGEWETALDGPTLALDRLADTPFARLGDADAVTARLGPVFTTRFRRETRMLRLPGGVEVELAIDQGTIACGRGRGRRVAAISEVELEVKAAPAGPNDRHGTVNDDAHDDAHEDAHDGDRAARRALLRFASRLARDVALLPLADSKAARGYRLVRGQDDAPTKVVLQAASASTDARRRAADVLAACARAATANLHALRAAAAPTTPVDDAVVRTSRPAASGHPATAAPAPVVDPEYVHQARVAVRKLRSALEVFAPVLDPRRAARIAAAWRTVGRALGTARDADVMVESAHEVAARALDEGDRDDRAVDAAFRDGAPDPDRADALRAAIDAAARLQRRDAAAALVAMLATPAAGIADLLLAREVDRLRRPCEPRALAPLASAWLDAQARRVAKRARRIAVLDDAARHALRIEVKRLRYGLGFFEGLYDDTGYADLAGELQDELGALADAVVQRDRLPSLLDADALADATRRYDRWLDRRLKKRLPKVAQLAVRLELEDRPWRR